MPKIWQFLALLIIFVLNSPSAWAYVSARFIHEKNGKRIKGLEWDQSLNTQNPIIKSCPQPNGTIELCVELKAKFTKNHTDLLLNTHKLVRNRNGEFRLMLTVKSGTVFYILRAIDPTGSIEEERVILSVHEADYNEAQEEFKNDFKRSLTFSPGIGLSYISYEQTGIPSITELAITTKVSGTYRFAPRWDVGAIAFFTLYPVSLNSSENQIRFFGFNLRFGYRLTKPTSPWGIVLSSGYYFTTTFSTPLQFGYQNLQGPQLYPSITRKLPSGEIVSFYVKYSPIFDSFSVLSLNNAEMAFGIGYSLRKVQGKGLSFNLDIAQLKLDYSVVQIRSNSYSLGISYSY